MRGGKYPQMPFNQQMSFPVELTLRTTPQGVRLFRWPVREIASIVAAERDVPAGEVKPGEDPLKDVSGELFDIEATIEVGDADAVGFDVRGTKVRWTKEGGGKIAVGAASAEMKPENGRIGIRLLVDRSSIELFGNGGAIAISSCFTPRPDRQNVNMAVEGAAAKIVSMKVRQLKSTWK
jgi:sucrose-6-phosphate hydrolase SacC (GH32 family)